MKFHVTAGTDKSEVGYHDLAEAVLSGVRAGHEVSVKADKPERPKPAPVRRTGRSRRK